MHQIEILDLVIEPDNYAVYRIENGQKESISLPKLSFELFSFLIENEQKICTLEQISEAVWHNTVVSNETITQRVTLLRKALNDDPKAPKYIESVRGRGYRLIVEPKQKSRPYSNKILLSSTIAFMLLGLSLLAYWFTQSSAQQAPSNVPPSAMQSEEISDSVSALLARAVYYFDVGQNENVDRAIELYTHALSLEPLNEEALVGLSMALNKSVCRYNQPASLATRGKQFATQALLLDSNDVNASKAQAAVAYSWDCLGNLERALEHYLLSIKLNPQNYRSISSAAHLFEIKGDLIRAYQLSVRAKQLEPNNHMADLQIARILELLNFTPEAQNAYKQLFVLYPDNVFISEAYPRFLFFQGHFIEAKNEIEKVLRREAGRYDIYLYYAELLWLLESKDEGIPFIQKAEALNPRWSYARNIQASISNQLSAEDAITTIAHIEELVAKGDTWPQNYIEASFITLWVMKDEGGAITFLQKAVNLGYLNSEYLRISPLFAQLRQRPRFFQLINEINQRREGMKQIFLAAYPPP
jgi:DNA-binding winged helix-turn-helix (wHTH) protein/Tfp pilus assembly protein PilF